MGRKWLHKIVFFLCERDGRAENVNSKKSCPLCKSHTLGAMNVYDQALVGPCKNLLLNLISETGPHGKFCEATSEK